MYKLIITKPNDSIMEVYSDDFSALKKVAYKYNAQGCDVEIFKTEKVFEVVALENTK